MDKEIVALASKEAEVAVIGCILMDPKCQKDVFWLTEDDFYYHDNRRLFNEAVSVCKNVLHLGRTPLIKKLKDLPEYVEGDEQKIFSCVDATPVSANVVYYATILRSMMARRFAARLCAEAVSQFSNLEMPIKESIKGVGEGILLLQKLLAQ